MKEFSELFQISDWKKEKHVPVIEIKKVTKEGVTVQVSIGKEIPHPNTSAHHIVWIETYFYPEGEKYPYQLGKFEFSSHGASIEGPDSSSIYTKPIVTFTFNTEKPGIIYALSYCNIHGLWVNKEELKL